MALSEPTSASNNSRSPVTKAKVAIFASDDYNQWSRKVKQEKQKKQESKSSQTLKPNSDESSRKTEVVKLNKAPYLIAGDKLKQKDKQLKLPPIYDMGFCSLNIPKYQHLKITPVKLFIEDSAPSKSVRSAHIESTNELDEGRRTEVSFTSSTALSECSDASPRDRAVKFSPSVVTQEQLDEERFLESLGIEFRPARFQKRSLMPGEHVTSNLTKLRSCEHDLMSYPMQQGVVSQSKTVLMSRYNRQGLRHEDANDRDKPARVKLDEIERRLAQKSVCNNKNL